MVKGLLPEIRDPIGGYVVYGREYMVDGTWCTMAEYMVYGLW